MNNTTDCVNYSIFPDDGALIKMGNWGREVTADQTDTDHLFPFQTSKLISNQTPFKECYINQDFRQLLHEKKTHLHAK